MSNRIALTNLGKYNEGNLVFEWLELPFTDEQFKKALEKIGIDGKRYEEYFISDYETDITGLKIGEYENVEELNDLITEYERLDEEERNKIAAIIESEEISLKEAMDCLEDIELIPDVKNDYDLGYYWIEESGCYDTKAMGNLARYIDYESFGRDTRIDEAGDYTSYGYVRKS